MSKTKARTKSVDDDPAWSLPSLREPRDSHSLERGLAILVCFTRSRPILGIADIADDLGMSRSTTHRYVIMLVALGYLEQRAPGKYGLGLLVTDLDSVTRSRPRELYSIGTAVHNAPRGVVAAVNLAAHSSMIALDDPVDGLGPHLVSTADRISAGVAHRREDER
jgi:DNA-binding IclR family transcriptional regulator